ncbi:nucleotidyltransferase family protein [Limnobaculum xujianqingii]|uniref:nucleotidyltransferase family protein n=1 Tax=Limnobaculum xujianqingii TaxID=2738837 RepID=UPI00112B214E|nr:NTP transferase domain-containing protein [Limnobaculum xujianqingii]
MPGILLIAAGKGERYRAAGGKGEKLMAPLSAHHGRPLFSVVLETAIASQLPLHIVTRPDNIPIIQLAADNGIAVTLLNSQSMGESIAAGVKATDDWDGWLIQPADMPEITVRDYHRIVQALQHSSQARLYWQEQPGHPVGFSQQWRDALCQLCNEEGAKNVINHSLLRLNGHPGVVIDRDFPEE